MSRHGAALAVVFVLVAASCGGGGGDAGGPGAGSDSQADSAESVFVGAAGGEVASPDGRFTLSIPAGALVEGVEISIGVASEDEWPEDVVGIEPRAVYRLEPDGLEFAEPALFQLTVPVVTTDKGVAPPVVVVRSGDGEFEVVELEVVIDFDTGTAVVAGAVEHFSWAVQTEGEVTIELERISPSWRDIGDTWLAALAVTNNDRFHQIQSLTVDLTHDSSFPVAVRESAEDRQIQLTSSEQVTFPMGEWECGSSGHGSYGVVVSGMLVHLPLTDRSAVFPVSVVVHVGVECRAVPGDDRDDGATEEGTAGGEATTDGLSTSFEIPARCEGIENNVPQPVPCAEDGTQTVGTSAALALRDHILTVDCQPGCGNPGDWPFHQYQIELWVGDDRAILCDDDPGFACRLTNMQTYEVLSPGVDGVSVPERMIADEGIGLELTGPWNFNAETGTIQLGVLPISQIVIQWWYGDEPVNSELVLLTIEGDDLEAFSDGLATMGTVEVVALGE